MIVDNLQIIEALLFASESPLTSKKIKEILPEVKGERAVKKLIAELDEKYESTGSALKVIELAGGFQIVTRDTFSTWVAQLYRTRSRNKLTRKGLETLAIIAYKQPITKIEVEKIRGVNTDGVVRTLIERNLITVKGREKAPGNPLLYGTTDTFLEYFGLKDISHLPKIKEIDELLKEDSKFLESLDQVALDQIHPDLLGLSSLEGSSNKSPELEQALQSEKKQQSEIFPEEGQDQHGTQDAADSESKETEE